MTDSVITLLALPSRPSEGEPDVIASICIIRRDMLLSGRMGQGGGAGREDWKQDKE